MRKKKIFILLLLSISFLGCTTGRAIVSDFVNLSHYNYATITDVMSYGGSPFLMSLEVEIFNALSTTRLTVIGDREVESLTEAQRQQLLLVRFSANQITDQHFITSTVTINFVEYTTGRPVASFSGSSLLGMSAAINSAVNKMNKKF